MTDYINYFVLLSQAKEVVRFQMGIEEVAYHSLTLEERNAIYIEMMILLSVVITSKSTLEKVFKIMDTKNMDNKLKTENYVILRGRNF